MTTELQAGMVFGSKYRSGSIHLREVTPDLVSFQKELKPGIFTILCKMPKREFDYELRNGILTLKP